MYHYVLVIIAQAIFHSFIVLLGMVKADLVKHDM
jgi:hypothetical protein